jgi:hypothetical protein
MLSKLATATNIDSSRQSYEDSKSRSLPRLREDLQALALDGLECLLARRSDGVAKDQL